MTIMYEQTPIPPKERKICLTLLSLFVIEGKKASAVVTEGQLSIFHSLLFPPKQRIIIVVSTQYGKSLMTALACIILSCVKREMVSVVAPTDEKAKIIVRYFREHIYDNILFSSQLSAGTEREKFVKEVTKERIVLRGGGGIFPVSAQTGNTGKTLEAAMGLGSKIVIGDEFCLVPDTTEATIFRMIAGQGEDALYVKIGNPFHREPPYTHFWDSWNDPRYHKIFIYYRQGLAEGRYTESFIAEARKKPLFPILFECKFPDIDVMDEKGWMPLLTRKEVEIAMDGAEQLDYVGEKVFGADPADGGIDEAVAVVRSINVAKIEFASPNVDVMEFVGASKRIID